MKHGTAAIAALSLLALPIVAQADPLKIRVGWVSATADAPLMMFGKQGITKHEGVSYTLEAVHFQGSPPMITAMATNDVDFVGFGFSTVPIAILNAQMTDLKIVADLFQDGVDGSYSNEFLVLKDSPIRTIADMKGKVAATNSAGSAIDMVLRAAFRKNGLEDKRDFTIIEAAFPNMPAILQDHKADLIASTRVFTADPAIRSYARTLFTQKDAIGRSEMAVLLARAPFLDKNRAVVIDYLEDSLRELHWYSDPAHHDEAIKIVADYTKVPASAYASWMFVTGPDFYHDPNGMPNLDALQANVEMQRDIGFVKAPLDVKKYADLSMMEEAAKRAK